MTSSVALIFFLIAIVIVGCIVFVVLAFTRKSSYLDTTKYRSRWMKVEQQLRRDQPASYQLAILEADKLLDQALKDRGISGGTMGERMKSFQPHWTNANSVWTAHKLRNQIAHETDVRINYEDTRRALGGFKQGLKDVGAI